MATICQSCSMPLSKDPEKGGTEKDGSKSARYCSLCYRNGAFTQPDMTAKDMQAFARKKLEEKGFPGFIAGFFTAGIPKLERWSQG